MEPNRTNVNQMGLGLGALAGGLGEEMGAKHLFPPPPGQGGSAAASPCSCYTQEVICITAPILPVSGERAGTVPLWW